MNSLPERIGKYQIESLLGRGGMGEVYKAFDSTLGRFVALKIMRGPALDDPNARERFVREAQAAGGLRHPNIVTVYDLGDVEGKLFIAMEFITGNDLEKIIKSRAMLSIEEKIGIMIQVCEGVAYAHRNQIVHRDLKPSNIRIDEEGIAKIMDFGIAKLESSSMTASGTVLGTPYYMSPEQVRGIRVDARSDLFSLGTILYELFTYRRAFDGELATVFYKIVNEHPAALSEFMNIPCDPLQTVIDRCLDKDKAKRYQTGAELAAALREAGRFFQQNEAATMTGIVMPDMQEKTEDFKLAPAPAAISSTRRTGVGSEPTSLSAPPQHTAADPTRMDPTKLVGGTHASAPQPTHGDYGASAAQQAGAPAPSPSVSYTPPTSQAAPKPGTSKAVIVLLIAFLIGGAAAVAVGGYFLWFGKKDVIGENGNGQKQQQPSTEYLANVEKGKQLFQQGKYEEASQIYSSLLQERPSDANVHFLNGAAKKEMGKTQEALLEFQRAVELDPNLVRAWEQIGQLLMNRMDYGNAEEAFRKAVDKDPKSVAGWEGLAQTYLAEQRLDQAQDSYEKLLELEPNNITAIYNLGLLQTNNDKDAAKESFKRVIALNPNFAEAHNNLGSLLLAEGQLDQSIIENEKAIQLKPILPSAHYSLFLAYEQKQDFPRAAVHLQKFLELTGDDDPELRQKLATYSRM